MKENQKKKTNFLFKMKTKFNNDIINIGDKMFKKKEQLKVEIEELKKY